MEAKCVAISSLVHAHLQSMLWCSSDVAVNLCSPTTSVNSCVTASTMPSGLFLPLIRSESYGAAPLVNTRMDTCSDHQHQTLTPTTKAVTGAKRILHMDEQRKKNKNPSKKSQIVPSVSRASTSVLDDETNIELVGQSCFSCCSSEEDSIATSEKSIVLKQSDHSRGRKQSSKGSQSLYAKKRRERINERLRILQQLIPNGTKVDISTMLEEAVQYVKFLQLQIKLLSSDETWMYAPLAYNGLNIGLGPSTAAEQE